MMFIYFICLSFIYIKLVVAITNADRINGQRFHKKAMEHVNVEQYDLALAYFRSACRHINDSSLYWNDLGVTEMRLGDLKRARKRFKKALAIDPTFEIALENLNELNTYQQTDDDDSIYTDLHHEEYSTQYQHTVLQPKILSKDEFHLLNSWIFTQKERNDPNINEKMEKILSEPFIIPNAFDLFNLTNEKLTKIFNRQYLTTHYGTEIVDFYPQNMKNLDSYPYFLSLTPALRQLINKPEEIYIDTDISESGTCIQWNLNEYIWEKLIKTQLAATIPGIFNDYYYLHDCLQPPTSTTTTSTTTTSVSNNNIEHSSSNNVESSYIENNGDILLNNKERTQHINNNNININNKERIQSQNTLYNQFLLATHWRMFLIGEQDCGMFFHSDTLHTSSYQLQILGSKKWHICSNNQTLLQQYDYSGKINLFHLNYKKNKNFKNLICYEIIVRTGDILYYPTNYYHQTLNLETPSLSLSGSILNKYNYYEFKEELKKECRGEGKIFLSSEYRELCEGLESCYLYWDRLWI